MMRLRRAHRPGRGQRPRLQLQQQRILAETCRALRATISCADHPCCTALFCSPLGGWHCFAFPCFALPRRHRSPTRPTLDCRSKCLDDQLLGRFVSVVHLAGLRLDRVSLSICADRYGVWSDSWIARFGNDPLGKTTRRTFLHSEPLARSYRHVGDSRTIYVWVVARHAFRRRRSRRSALADHGFRNSAFPGSRRGIDRLLPGLLHWSQSTSHAPRATTVLLKCRRVIISHLPSWLFVH
jgi:hypothetical protein